MSTHPVFANKPNDDAIVWRFMSLEKFINLLITNELHFSRIDKFEDHFEGMWPVSDTKYFRSLVEKNKKNFDIEAYTKIFRRQTAISCWHENPHESAAMWQLYNPSNDGVAIQTTFGKLKSEFLNAAQADPNLNLCDIARVEYINHMTDNMVVTGKELPNLLRAPMSKNISYQFENEVRALISFYPQFEINEPGYKLKINSNNLIDAVIVNPRSPTRLFETVSSILVKYSSTAKLKKSDLSKSFFEESYK